MEVKHIRAQYAGEVTLVDKWIGLFLNKIKELDLWDNTLIILLSDHGEPLGEHGIIRKVKPWPYEELSRIVLMIKPPAEYKGGRRSKTFVQTPDIVMPTILDLLKIDGDRSPWSVLPKIQGKSLLPIITEESDSIQSFAIAGHYRRSWSIRNEGYSLYLWPYKENEKRAPELYKLNRNYVPPKPDDWDVGEQPEVENIAEEEKEVRKELELKLRSKLMAIMDLSNQT